MVREEMIKFRDILRDVAGATDEIIQLDVRVDAGEDVTKELVSAIGKLYIKMADMQLTSIKSMTK